MSTPNRYPLPPDLAHRYAAISGDNNPLHLDEKFAKKAGFKTCIVHGMLTLGLWHWMRQIHDPTQRLQALSARFREPLYVGEGITLHLNKAGKDEIFGGQGQALFKNFQPHFVFSNKNSTAPCPKPAAFLHTFPTETITLTKSSVAAYTEMLHGVFGKSPASPSAVFLLAGLTMRELLKHLNEHHCLHQHRILHLSERLTLSGPEPKANQGFLLEGGITAENQKFGQDFFHFSHRLFSETSGFWMVLEGLGSITRL